MPALGLLLFMAFMKQCDPDNAKARCPFIEKL